MARKKRSNKNVGIIAVVIIVSLIAVASFYLYLNNPFQQASLPLDSSCYVKGSSTAQNSFKCDSPKCAVIVRTTCNTKTGSPKVIFRTSASTSADYDKTTTWIAFDRGTGNLQGYAFNANKYSSTTQLTNPLLTFNGIQLFYISNVLYLGKGEVSTTQVNCDYCCVGKCHGFKKYIRDGTCKICSSCVPDKVKTCDTVPLYLYNTMGDTNGADLTPNTKYNCDNIHEKCAGDSYKYYCSSDIKIDNTLYKTIIYNAPDTGQNADSRLLTSGLIELKSGQTITATGMSIDWAIIDDSKACSVSKCSSSNDGYNVCVKSTCPELSSTFTPCLKGESCTQTGTGGEAKCSTPFRTSGKFTNDRGDVEKTGYALSENIYFQYNIDSSTIKNVNLDFVLVDLNGNELTPKQSKSVTSFPQTYKLSFPARTVTGTYKVRVDIRYSDVLTPEYYQFSVANPITLAIHATGEAGEGSLFTNEITTVEVRVLDEAGEYTSASVKKITASIEGTDLTYVDADSSLGKYEYMYNIPKEGKLRVSAEVEKLGFTATQSSEFVVNPADVQVKFTNVENLQNIAFGTYAVTFETRTPHGSLLSTSNKFRMLKPDGTFENIAVVNGNNGQYSISFNFDKEGGYKPYVTSSAVGFTTKETEDVPFINVIKEGGEVLECTSNDQCTLGKICQDNVCISSTPETPWLMYLTITVVSIMIIVVLILIFKLLKKRKSTQIDSSFVDI